MNFEKAIENLKRRSQDIQHYVNIIDKVNAVDVSSNVEFQKEFNHFYKIRRNSEWRYAYYTLFEEYKKREKVTFDEVINDLFRETGKVEPSFASKMLASINPNMPIWDSKVLARIGIISSKKKGEEKVKETIRLYGDIVSWYENLISNTEEKNRYIENFDLAFPQFRGISDVKKIDFILWAAKEETKAEIIIHSGKQDTDYQQELKKLSSLSVNVEGITNALSSLTSTLPKYQMMAKNLSKSVSVFYQNILPTIDFQKQIVESIRPAFEGFSKIFANIQIYLPKIEIPESLLKSLGNIRYLYILKEIQWPLFLEEDDEIRNKITSMCDMDDKKYPLDNLASEICKIYSADKIELLAENWKTMCSNSDRLRILEEAIQLHNSGFYFGATSLLMCQVDGLICEITEFANDNNLSIDEVDEKAICQSFNIKYENHVNAIRKKHPSERHLMLRLMMYPESGFFYWQAVTEYIFKIVLTSEDNIYEEHNPLRNKICHGDHLTFGTEEKSLKSILIINLLLNLQADLDWMISEQKMLNNQY